MSRILSHREAKAAHRVVGDHAARVTLLEGVIKALLKRQSLEVVVTAKGQIDLTEAVPQEETPVTPRGLDLPASAYQDAQANG